MEHRTASERGTDSSTAQPPDRPRATLAPAGEADDAGDLTDLDVRSQRARMERMAVEPIGGGVYEVRSQSGATYSVDLPGGRCTCPDHVFRGVRCKHLRRVAMEVTEGLVPPPGQRAVDCANCGAETFVDERSDGPHVCEDCWLAPGTLVVDRERGDLLVTVRTTTRRANQVGIPGQDRTVAEYPTNAGYDETDLVVEVLYPIPAGLDEDELQPHHLRRYSFPRGRLRRARDPEVTHEDQAALADFAGQA